MFGTSVRISEDKLSGEKRQSGECEIMRDKYRALLNEITNEDILEVEKRWGYFSNNKDNEVHKFDLCEECYDEFVGTFQIPIEIE